MYKQKVKENLTLLQHNWIKIVITTERTEPKSLNRIEGKESTINSSKGDIKITIIKVTTNFRPPRVGHRKNLGIIHYKLLSLFFLVLWCLTHIYKQKNMKTKTNKVPHFSTKVEVSPSDRYLGDYKNVKETLQNV